MTRDGTGPLHPAAEWRPSDEYRRIAAANRHYYNQTASQYDTSETCVVDRKVQEGLEQDLAEVLALLMIGRKAGDICAMDACGGSGNVSLKLLARGVNVVLVDVSPDLQAIFLSKCEAKGFVPRVVCADVAEFLGGTKEQFDLITFSSALHHLENYREVLLLACKRLRPGGMIFTTFDPTLRERMSGLSRLVLKLDYYSFKVLDQPSDLPATVWRRLSRFVRRQSASDKDSVALDGGSVGMLAEYHVEKGIDDVSLVRSLVEAGLDVVWHHRRAEARYAWSRWLLRRLGAETSFKLLVRVPEPPAP